MKPFSAAPSQEGEDERLNLVAAPPVIAGCRFVLLEDAWTDLPRLPQPIPVDYFEDLLK